MGAGNGMLAMFLTTVDPWVHHKKSLKTDLELQT
jgi:hypothetical protein